jgi:histidyl-tRNA synthetase
MLVHFGGETRMAALELAGDLRGAGLGAFFAFARERRSMKSQMREADRRQVRYTLILGEDELAQGVVTVRSMDGGEQFVVPRDQIVNWLQHVAGDNG